MSNYYVGILGMEVYFPSTYVSQEDLEIQNNCKGKYTIGLGQDAMAFCGDREDINSIALTVVNNLLSKYSIPLNKIGRLEIGTETLLDKSKSTKTVLMDLFASSGNTDIEGVTVVNACYGGTAALLNSLCWVDSSSWDGRYSIVVAADIAVYADGPARPTGGCGAVAMLIGRNAPLPINLQSRTCYSSHVWDFFKPKMDSEYPEVNGALSQTCYLKALDDCYNRFVIKQSKIMKKNNFSLNLIDEFLFHSPYNKLVQKSFSRLVYLDMLAEKLPNHTISKWLNIPIESTYEDKELENKLKEVSGPLYQSKVAVGCYLSKQIGNTYTASLYMNLANLISQKGNQLLDKRIALFSYGSGAMASLFEIQPRSTYSEFTLERIQIILNISARLADRQKMSPEDLSHTLEIREKVHANVPYNPVCVVDNLYPGTFYLDTINSSYERKYVMKSIELSRVSGPMTITNGSTMKKTPSTGEDDDFYTGGISMDSPNIPRNGQSPLNGSSAHSNKSGLSLQPINASLNQPSIAHSQTMVWASGKLMVKVVVTGVAAALPGRDKQVIIKDGESNIKRIIDGENFITEIPKHVKDAMLEKNMVETIKTSDGKIEKRRISRYEDNINLCAAIGKINLSDYGVSESIASTMDFAVQVAIVAGLEALKHAGITNGKGPNGWVLPESMQDTTGVVFATSFPALDTAIAEVSKFYESKALTNQRLTEIISILKQKLVERTENRILSEEVESAIAALVAEAAHSSKDDDEIKPYEFDRKFLFRVLVLGNAQLAQIIKVKLLIHIAILVIISSCRYNNLIIGARTEYANECCMCWY
jgi:hydroxymethylglutaryl-CoA synthase